MARTVADINRACTPMHYVEENLDDSREVIREKKKLLEISQKAKSPFLIGSIEEVNKKISNLDQKLQSYTELVIESRASVHSLDEYVPPASAKLREIHQKKEKESREVNQFAGIFSIKATFLSKPSERVKNISKITMNPSKTSLKKDSGKPKFVELHQFPGYNASELTPLPNDTSAIEVLTKVANAQPHLKQKGHYRPEFERLFYSQMSQAVLQDIFWWVFLNKWQPSTEYQQKLFNRVAHNYVKLMMYAKHPQYRDTFLKDYPSLLSQAIYSAYCLTFPDSYRMFAADFKEDLVVLVHEWVAGNRPAPRVYLSWCLEELEPAGLSQREKLIKQSKAKKSSTLNLDFLDVLSPGGPAHSESRSTLNHVSSLSSISSGGTVGGPPRGRQRAPRGLGRPPLQASSRVSESSTSGITQVAEAQPSYRQTIKPDPRPAMDPLTPIREFDETTPRHGRPQKESKVSMLNRSPRLNTKESHPIGAGADFEKCSFNTYGQSPLVAHFLRQKRLQVEAGLHARVQRTEIRNLPPLDALTYRDLIQESFRKVKDTETKYNILAERGQEEHRKFINKQKADFAEHKRRETALLSNRREVKRLSDLILLELKKDRDSIGAGVGLAIDAALSAVDV